MILHPLFLSAPSPQGDYQSTPLGSCRLQLQEFKGTTLQLPFKESLKVSFLRLGDSATPPLERPPVAQNTIILGLGLSAVHATCQWLLLIGIGGFTAHDKWLLP
ncbi:hypothetical protein DFH29DRAFT_881984 [Suillus ampliporus]|nr:hypothetical protein DFH29DRAFT_881984 [Suillus ampliporus]